MASEYTVAKFIWLLIESAIQAHFAEMYTLSSSQENEFSNSIHSYSKAMYVFYSFLY